MSNSTISITFKVDNKDHTDAVLGGGVLPSRGDGGVGRVFVVLHDRTRFVERLICYIKRETLYLCCNRNQRFLFQY